MPANQVNLMSCGALRSELAAGQTAYMANVGKTTLRLGRTSVGGSVIGKSETQATRGVADFRCAQWRAEP